MAVWFLSENLAEQIAMFDEALTAEELAGEAAEREALLRSVEQLYQGTSPTKFLAVYKLLRTYAGKLPTETTKELRASAESQLDECLSRLTVSEIPRMVTRALQLEPMLIEQGHADENPYLGEATRCFLFGLFNASVALSRSALEQAFYKRVPLILQGGSKDDRLQVLIKTARTSVLKQTTEVCDVADRVRRRM